MRITYSYIHTFIQLSLSIYINFNEYTQIFYFAINIYKNVLMLFICNFLKSLIFGVISHPTLNILFFFFLIQHFYSKLSIGKKIGNLTTTITIKYIVPNWKKKNYKCVCAHTCKTRLLFKNYHPLTLHILSVSFFFFFLFFHLISCDSIEKQFKI